MKRGKVNTPFEHLDLGDQVQQMRPLARSMLLTGHPEPVDDMSLLPDVISERARLPPESTDPRQMDRAVFDQLSRVYNVSFSLGIAIGQLAPWIGEPKGGRR